MLFNRLKLISEKTLLKLTKRNFPRNLKSSNLNILDMKEEKENPNFSKTLDKKNKKIQNFSDESDSDELGGINQINKIQNEDYLKEKKLFKNNNNNNKNKNESDGDSDFDDIPELNFLKSKKNKKSIIRNEEEKREDLIKSKVKRMVERDSDPSDEDVYMTGEEGKEINYDDYFDTFFLARVNDKLPLIPPDIQNMAKRVFSKHSFKDIKFWSEKFLLNYSQNHACEPPIDLSSLPEDSPRFGNSEELNIKIKLFKQLDLLEDIRTGKKDKKNDKDKEKEDEENSNDKNSVKLDIHHTIDINQERKLKREKENLNTIKVIYNQATAVAYLYCRMPYTYQVCRRILTEIIFRMPDFKPKSVLDFGAGLGSAIWAADHVYENMITKFAAVEPNRDMRRLGKYLTSTSESDILWVESLTMIPGAGIERGKFDIVFISYVLQELPTAKMRVMVLDTLWNRLSNDGVMIIVEPGSPKGFRFLTDVRKWVIDKPREDANIVAPCPHHMECPLANRSETWCHFSQLSYKYNKDVITKTQKQKQIFNEKFTYLVVRKGKTPSVVYKDESEADTPEEKSFFWERIVRPVIKKHRHRIVDLCTKNGKFES